tara:strand:- start:16 stop:336 length:321 start_codon:yes stop_codon:yes gene_type:complete
MRINRSPILPVGSVNLETGEFEYGNIYGFWGEDTTYELYKTDDGYLRVVATAGREPIVPLGERSSFQHDQTGRYLFSGEVIDVATGDEGLKSFIKYKKRITCATYK